MRPSTLLALLATMAAAEESNETIQRNYFSHATEWNSCEPPSFNETCLVGNNIPTTGCRRTNDLCEGTNQSYAIILLTDYAPGGCHYNLWIWSCAAHWLTCEDGRSCACVHAHNASTCACESNITNAHHCLPEHLTTSTPTTSATSTPTTSMTSTITSSATSTPTTSVTSTITSSITSTPTMTMTPATLTPTMTTLLSTMCPTTLADTSGSSQGSKSTEVVEKTPWWIPVICILAGILVGALIAMVAQRKMAPRAPSPAGRQSFYNPVYSDVGSGGTNIDEPDAI